jgi:hypothetical protein
MFSAAYLALEIVTKRPEYGTSVNVWVAASLVIVALRSKS